MQARRLVVRRAELESARRGAWRRHAPRGLLLSSTLTVLLSACGGDGGSPGGGDGDAGSGDPLPARFAAVADWAQGTLSLVDYDALLAQDATRASATVRTVDLSAYPPGPIDVAITPDRKQALVSCSSNFFVPPAASFLLGSSLPAGRGGLVLVDLEGAKVVKEIGMISNPTAIAFTEGGKRAVVVGFGSGQLGAPGSLELVDLERQEVVESVPVGTFPEELALDDTGQVGLFSFGTAGQLRAFLPSDPSQLSPEISLPGDTAGIAFFPGTKTAFAIQAVDILGSLSGGSSNGGYTIVDVSDPKAPVVTDDVRLDESPIGYPVTPAPNRGTVLTAVSVDGRLVVREYGLENGKAKLVNSFDLAETADLFAALSVTYDGDHTALITWPKNRSVVALDLSDKSVRTIDWSAPNGAVGPADITLSF